MLNSWIFSNVPLLRSDAGDLCIPIEALCIELGVDWFSVLDRFRFHPWFHFSKTSLDGEQVEIMAVSNFPFFFAGLQPWEIHVGLRGSWNETTGIVAKVVQGMLGVALEEHLAQRCSLSIMGGPRQ